VLKNLLCEADVIAANLEVDLIGADLLEKLNAAVGNNPHKHAMLLKIFWHCYFDPACLSQISIAKELGVSDLLVSQYRKVVDDELKILDLNIDQFLLLNASLARRIPSLLKNYSASQAIGHIPKPQNDDSASSRIDRPPSPPKFGEYLIYLFISRNIRDNLLGDLQEEFLEVYGKFEERKARIWYYNQVLKSLYPLIRRFIIKWGLIGLIGKWVSKIMS
jgi:hypothetical protein